MSTEFLGVKHSLSNKIWIGPSAEQERVAAGIHQEYGISLLTALMLTKRGVNVNALNSHLSPKIKDLMPDPHSLQDMEKASTRLLQSIQNQEKICIFADYDVDGTSSAAILILWLKHFKIVPQLYIPDRVEEGYGPNVKAMETLSKKMNSFSVLIVVPLHTMLSK